MRFDVYCDESRPELLSSKKPEATYMVIGSLWLPTDKRAFAKSKLHQLREKHRIGPEWKWQKVSNSRYGFYADVIDWFVRDEDLRFRCVAVDWRQVDLITFHDEDAELGFYKFYYQLLHHWILDFNQYAIFCDFKTNRRRDRFEVLHRCLRASNLAANVKTVQPIRSEQSVLLQLADLLTGAAASRLNGSLQTGSAKHDLLTFLEKRLNRRIAATYRGENKFNVFKMNLEGGW